MGARIALQVVCVGRVRPPFADLAREYEERISQRRSLRVDEVASEPLQHGDDRSRTVEAARIGERLVANAWIVALTPTGRRLESTEAFADWFGRRMDVPRPTAFVIGGAAGLSDAFIGDADETLSLGPLTLPHQLARVVLMEQLYRAQTILDGHPYHH